LGLYRLDAGFTGRLIGLEGRVEERVDGFRGGGMRGKEFRCRGRGSGVGRGGLRRLCGLGELRRWKEEMDDEAMSNGCFSTLAVWDPRAHRRGGDD